LRIKTGFKQNMISNILDVGKLTTTFYLIFNMIRYQGTTPVLQWTIIQRIPPFYYLNFISFSIYLTVKL